MNTASDMVTAEFYGRDEESPQTSTRKLRHTPTLEETCWQLHTTALLISIACKRLEMFLAVRRMNNAVQELLEVKKELQQRICPQSD